MTIKKKRKKKCKMVVNDARTLQEHLIETKSQKILVYITNNWMYRNKWVDLGVLWVNNKFPVIDFVYKLFLRDED